VRSASCPPPPHILNAASHINTYPDDSRINPLTSQLNPSTQRCLPRFLLDILIFKGLTARHLYKSLGVKEFSKYDSNLPTLHFNILVVVVVVVVVLIFCGSTAERGLWSPHLRGFLITHNGASQSVELLWTSDQLVAETSTWQHTLGVKPTIATGERP
jgi:hypothetical protein